MSLINGISGLGSGLNAFAGGAVNDAMTAQARAPLVSTAAPATASPPSAPSASTPDQIDGAAAAPTDGSNPYSGPHADALLAAENAIKGPESGGKADAQNPTTSAGGLFQITNGTFSAALQKMGFTPPSSQDDLNTLKYNSVVNTKVMRQINADAADTLDAQGLPVNVQTLQAAHRLGPSGAAEAIKAAIANPDAPLVGNGLAPDAVRGNGDISRMTVGQFLASPYPKAAGAAS
jgi:hypothetical protein